MDDLRFVGCTINRVTTSDKVLEPEERLSVYNAFKVVTVDVAIRKMDNEVGKRPGRGPL